VREGERKREKERVAEILDRKGTAWQPLVTLNSSSEATSRKGGYTSQIAP
jgi:hypothetical protein